jgi:hypothetical protein
VTTLIAVYNSEGCQGRCDAKCYAAREPECECICGGRNHGADPDQAVCNTRELAQGWSSKPAPPARTSRTPSWPGSSPANRFSDPQAREHFTGQPGRTTVTDLRSTASAKRLPGWRGTGTGVLVVPAEIQVVRS